MVREYSELSSMNLVVPSINGVQHQGTQAQSWQNFVCVWGISTNDKHYDVQHQVAWELIRCSEKMRRGRESAAPECRRSEKSVESPSILGSMECFRACTWPVPFSMPLQEFCQRTASVTEVPNVPPVHLTVPRHICRSSTQHSVGNVIMKSCYSLPGMSFLWWLCVLGSVYVCEQTGIF